MTADELQQFLKDQGVGSGMAEVSAIISHPDYALPTLEWVNGDFAAALDADLIRLQVSKYDLDFNNCVDFAYNAVAIAKLCNALTPGAPSHLLFGFIGYMRMQGLPMPEGHRINFTVIFDGAKHVLVWFEPQTQRQVTLTPEEIASIHCYYV